METKVKTTSGSFDIEAGIRRIGDDLLVAIWGGEKPHIGAVSVAQSRPSLKNPETKSATASVICFPAHKEDELAKAVSEVLSAVLDTRVVVTAGIHWDNLSKDGIKKVINNSDLLVDLILKEVL
ncbi:MAG: hypothetical protein KJO26_08500 [Deltaproteobacteria bacterium]|nr:hypothetical protein [Deltaproteobacteria bacterium]